MITALLAVDVGGSSSRALLVDRRGTCLGRGASGGGNPGSNPPDLAARAIVSAAEAAVVEAGIPDLRIELVLLAMAGPRGRVDEAALRAGFAALGLAGPIVFTGDIQALLASVSASGNGYCLVCGTGAGAARVRGGEIEKVADAAGWLLGDAGSGYWLGHMAARAVTADLECRGPKTTLTSALLGALGVPLAEDAAPASRPAPLRGLIEKIYSLRPIELAGFAPLVIANRRDRVAAALLAEAEAFLLDDFRLVFDPGLAGPVALGGGVIPHLSGLLPAIRETLRAAGHDSKAEIVRDGATGAALLALKAAGLTPDDRVLVRLRASVNERV